MDEQMKTVEFPIESAQQFFTYWAKYGQQMVVTLIMLVVGIFLIQRVGPYISQWLGKFDRSKAIAMEITIGFYVASVALLLGLVLWNLGVGGIVVRQLIMAAALIAAALALLLKKYLPKMPFKVGHMIKTGSLMGRVVDISLLNTRLRTIDGLIVVVPNAIILNDYLVNYHTTPNRRVRVDVAIRYDQDVVKAKGILESLFVADPRVLAAPRPTVRLTKLDESWIQIGGRGWVPNAKAFATRTDLEEKVKYAFDHAGIQIAFPRRDVHVSYANQGSTPNSFESDDVASRVMADSDLPEVPLTASGGAQ